MILQDYFLAPTHNPRLLSYCFLAFRLLSIAWNIVKSTSKSFSWAPIFISKKSLFKAWRLFIYTLLAIWFAKGFCFPVIETYNYDFPKWSCYQIWWKSWLILCLLVTRSFFFCFSTNYKSNQGEAIRPRRIRTSCL